MIGLLYFSFNYTHNRFLFSIFFECFLFFKKGKAKKQRKVNALTAAKGISPKGQLELTAIGGAKAYRKGFENILCSA